MNLLPQARRRDVLLRICGYVPYRKNRTELRFRAQLPNGALDLDSAWFVSENGNAGGDRG